MVLRPCVVLCSLLLAMPASAGELPEVEVSDVRRVFHNGEHNAFTDLVRKKEFSDLYFIQDARERLATIERRMPTINPANAAKPRVFLAMFDLTGAGEGMAASRTWILGPSGISTFSLVIRSIQ